MAHQTGEEVGKEPRKEHVMVLLLLHWLRKVNFQEPNHVENIKGWVGVLS
jgi:hypothetical protein